MNFKKIYFLINYLYYINFSYEINNYLLFPIKKINENYTNSDTSTEILNKLVPNNIYLSLKVGSSQININSFLSLTQSFLSFGQDTCLSNDEVVFNIAYSSSYNFISNITISNIDLRKYEKLIYFQDTVIYSNYSKEIKIRNMDCYSYTNNEIIKCSIFGLDLNRDKTQNNLLIAILEENKFSIKKSYLTVIFKNISNIFQRNKSEENIDGEILLGPPPHEYYKNLFLEKELIEINTQSSRDKLSWIIRFDNVYIEDKKNNSIKYFTFDKVTYYDFDQYYGVFFPEINPIYVPNNIFDYYIDNYFYKYLNKECLKRGRPLYNKFLTNSLLKRTNIFVYCYKEKIKDKYTFYDEFPSLLLKNIYFKEIFSFEGKELFYEDNNYIYFTLLPEYSKQNKFLLGRIFMSKYQFTFNYDTKTIGYYNKNNSYINNNKSNEENEISRKNNLEIKEVYIIMLILVLFFIVLVFLVYYLYKCFNKKANIENQALELIYMKREDEIKKKYIFSLK